MNKSLLALMIFCAGLVSAQSTYQYTGPVRDLIPSEPQISSGPILPASDGNFYRSFADVNGGRIERLTPDGVVTVIHSFDAGVDAAYEPVGNLIQGTDGYLYGQLGFDTVNGYGDFFKIALDGSDFTLLYAFDYPLDGGVAQGGLTLSADGNFYGFGSSWLYDSDVSSHRSAGARSLLRSKRRPSRFPEHFARGRGGQEPGEQSRDHRSNGLSACTEPPVDTFYQLTPAGQMTLLECTYGSDPLNGSYSAPVQASDGYFYAFTSLSVSGSGELVKLDSSGNETTVGPAPDGTAYSLGSLAGGPDGNFYVSVIDNDCGGILQIVPSDSYETGDNQLNCTQGEAPVGPLYLGTDAAFYGAATADTTSGGGSVFAVSPYVGEYDYVYHFNGTSGGFPTAPAIQGRDGNFYGATAMTDTAGEDDLPTYYRLIPSTALAAPVMLTSPSSTVVSGTALSLTWSVNNASPLTPPVCIALVANATGPAGWTGILTGQFFDNGVYGGSSSLVPSVSGNLSDYQIVCNGQGSASATYAAPLQRSSATSFVVGPAASMATGTEASFSVTVSAYNGCGVAPVGGPRSNAGANGCAAPVHPLPQTGRDGGGSGLRGGRTVQPDLPLPYPTGTVKFMLGANTLSQVTLTDGSATLPLNTLGVAPGTYAVTADYEGDSVYSASSTDQTITITKLADTATLTITDVGGLSGPFTIGDPVKFQASVASSGNGAGATGTVSFYFESNLLCSGSLTGNGTASCELPTVELPAGSYPVHAVYHGDDFHASATSGSVAVVLKKASTKTTVAATSPNLPEGGNDTFTAQVTSTGLSPTGTVLIHDSWYKLCTATVVNGTATCVAQASERTYQTTYEVTATYQGDAANNASSSAPTPVKVTSP